MEEEEKLLASKHGKHVLLRRPKLQLLSENLLTDSKDKYKNALHASFKSYGNSLKGNSVKLSSGSVDLDIANVDVQLVKNNKIGAFTTFIDNSFTLKLRPLGRPNVIAPQMTTHSPLSAEDGRKGLISNAFSLQDFMAETTKIDSLPADRVEKIIYAQSGDRFRKVLENKCQSKCKKLHIKQFDLPDDLPNFTHRIPQRQLLIEMASVIKEHFLQSSGVKLKASIQASSRFRPCFQHDKNLGAEIIFYQNYVANLHKLHLNQLRNSEVPGKSTFLSTAASNYFQGTKRSSSPFDMAFSNSISPAEVSVLESVLNGGETLSLKAHFISNLPEVQPLMNTLVYLDLSFNNFEEIPSEVFNFTNLNKLKLRNNPLNELPYEITRLQTIKTLIISFCLFDDFPQHLFEMKGLEELNISYNTISCIPSDIACLQKLYSLNIEGNKLHSLPASMLKMFNLRNLQADNNFMHPVFWNDTKATTDSFYAMDELCRESQIVTVNPGFVIQRQCDFCYGQINNSTGYQAVRPLKILGLRNLPFFFCCCSEKCFHSALKAEVINP